MDINICRDEIYLPGICFFNLGFDKLRINLRIEII